MRLRLRIERNALPPTQAIWPVKDGKSTIAQLVQHINEVFPLEGDTWGLEDYTVSVGGYECLHYHDLEAVCKEDDELLVKPLQYVDKRARTLTGRDQIAADGRHLVDGIPFGRPCLKAPVRPEVRIPPRKKRRLLEDGEGGAQAVPLLLTEQGEEMYDEDEDEDDEDFEMDETEADSEDNEGNSRSESEDSDESESATSDTSSSVSSSDDSSDSGSEESWSGLPLSGPATPTSKNSNKLSNGVLHERSPSATAGSKPKRKSDDEAHETEEGHSNKAAKVNVGVPGTGDARTKQRNVRRRESNKLKQLKKLQILPPEANIQAMREWEGTDLGFNHTPRDDDIAEAGTEGAADKEELAAATNAEDSVMPEVNGELEAVTIAESTNHEAAGDHVQSEDQDTAQTTQRPKKKAKRSKDATRSSNNDFEAQREKLMSTIASGGIDVSKADSKKAAHPLRSALGDSEGDEPPQELSSKQQKPLTDSVDSDKPTTNKSTLMIPSSAARRSQLDLAGSKRLLFGSLGVRVPKTQEEKDRVQKKLAERPKGNTTSTEQDNQDSRAGQLEESVATACAATGTEEDPEAWRDMINLTAVECCDEGVTLSTPPFPFYQRWDPQHRRPKARERTSDRYMDGTAKRRHGEMNMQHFESYDKYNTNGNGDALDYDDAEGDDDEFWEEGALLDEEYEEEPEEDDGFPSLPIRLDELPTLHENAAQQGDFIAFTELACDEGTEWQPKILTRLTKIVESPASGEHDKVWVLQLSSKDRKLKVFDDNGDRVYSKFEMPELDVVDGGHKEVAWTDLGVVRLVLRPEVDGDK